ncbi:Mechanosensitive ion channel MscS [Dillenia turbinata]|uniref:Mechanosensitive ion channel MscS n=1 Tax=Dillenia turbinata TaxID=194707 RepID=A0AAN8YZW6_9MAGN
MAARRFFVLKSISASLNPSTNTHLIRPVNEFIRPTFASLDQNFNLNESPHNSPFYRRYVSGGFLSTLSNLTFRGTGSFVSLSSALSYRSYSSGFGGKGDGPKETDVPAVSGGSDGSGSVGDVIRGDWMDSVKDAWRATVDTAAYTGEKLNEVSDGLAFYAQQLLDSHPYLKTVIVPTSVTLTSTLLAWVVMPRLLRRFHRYSVQGPLSLIYGSDYAEQVPYEKSVWGALEDPARYLVTFITFSQIAAMVAPTTVASQYIGQASRGAVIISFIWFLYRWKTNVFSLALTSRSLGGIERDKLLALDKFSTVGMFVIGVMALAEACGVAVQSILTVGGIGGVATAFAARDILGNVLSGLSLQFTRPFSLGDTIKAGSIEGQVVDIGLTTTSLLNAEKFPVIVPNSMFSSQVIVNKSRAQWHAWASKIPFCIDELDKIPLISDNIKSMMKSHKNVFLGKEIPYCFVSQIGSSYVELTLGCNFKHMSKDELFTTEQEILVQAAKIIKQHRAKLDFILPNVINE